MKTFPENTLSHFTTLLPQQLNLTGCWKIALSEIAWPATIPNITLGSFKYKIVVNPTKDNESYHNTLNRRRGKRPYGMVSMHQPALATATEQSIEKIVNIKPGFYSSVDQIIQSISKKIFDLQEFDDKKCPLSWKLDGPSETLKVYYEGCKTDCISLEATSQDLQNVLGLQTLIDCQKGENDSPPDAKVRSKAIGKFPVDLSGGCNTIFLYCDLVQNEILGDTRGSLLRAIPVNQRQTSDGGQQNYHCFGNLQWRRVVKSSIESITVSLRNETGHLIPFLSRGRTSLTLHFQKMTAGN